MMILCKFSLVCALGCVICLEELIKNIDALKILEVFCLYILSKITETFSKKIKKKWKEKRKEINRICSARLLGIFQTVILWVLETTNSECPWFVIRPQIGNFL